ncbi:MAG: hypothetical protein BMS9Abin20_0916 [Acidimicrobiia bacterium]|nr:MAG: hypothetical protein BMS9Abin20_0916 [Acidimicrobiia bacterium]
MVLYLRVPRPCRRGRAIDLIEHILSNLEYKVGPYTEDVGVERGVVDLAHRQPVRHSCLSAFRMWNDVCSFEELSVSQPTHRMPRPIRAEHCLTERLLIDALLDRSQ